MHIYLSHNFTNIGNMELECGDCLKLFTFAKLKEHKRQVHSTKKCELCNHDVKKYFKREETTFEGSYDGEVVNRHLLFTEDLDTFLDFICQI